MMMHKITPSLDENNWLKGFETKLNEKNQSIKFQKVPKVVITNKKTL